MTHAELADAVELYASLGRTHIPVPISIWREMMDGISQEFGIDVETVEIMEPFAMSTKSIGRADIKTDAKGKTKLSVPDTTPKHFKVAKRNKATAEAAGLVRNRDAKR